MNKMDFMNELSAALQGISEEERVEILYDYEEHFAIGKQNGKSEQEICFELGSPRELANSYFSNHSSRNWNYTNNDFSNYNNRVRNYKKRNFMAGSAIIIGVLMLGLLSYNVFPKHVKQSIGVNNGNIEISNSGIHGAGIDIDDKGIRMPGLTIDENGIKAPGVTINDKGITAPGVSIKDDGIKVELPNMNVNIGN